jgi:hypothetical protein
MFCSRWSSGPQNQGSNETNDTSDIQGVARIALDVGALINFMGDHSAVMRAGALNSDALTWPAVCTRSIGVHTAIGNCEATSA